MIKSARADREKICVLMMALFCRNTLCIARKKDDIRAQIFRKMPQAIYSAFTQGFCKFFSDHARKAKTVRGSRQNGQTLRYGQRYGIIMNNMAYREACTMILDADKNIKKLARRLAVHGRACRRRAGRGQPAEARADGGDHV